MLYEMLDEQQRIISCFHPDLLLLLLCRYNRNKQFLKFFQVVWQRIDSLGTHEFNADEWGGSDQGDLIRDFYVGEKYLWLWSTN
jgi:hypothetical protein